MSKVWKGGTLRERMCCLPFGKLETLSTMGQVSEGDTKLQTHLNTNVTLNHNHAFDNNVIKLSAVNPAHSYFVVGETPKGRIQFMIDTGAAVSLVRRDICMGASGRKPLKHG